MQAFLYPKTEYSPDRGYRVGGAFAQKSTVKFGLAPAKNRLGANTSDGYD